MKKTLKILGIIAIIAMVMLGADAVAEDYGDDFVLVVTDNFSLDVENDTGSYIGGEITLNVWKGSGEGYDFTVSMYNGNDTVEFDVAIVSKQTVNIEE